VAVARVVVDVMLKPEILDPQGRAVQGALGRLGLTGITSVRQGKRFELEIDGEIDEELSAQLTELAGSLLSNPVIEDYEIYEEVGDADSEADCDCGECHCGAVDEGVGDAGAAGVRAGDTAEAQS
jgi:phosphoribosylformylglycinamidine synthase subunit PurS